VFGSVGRTRALMKTYKALLLLLTANLVLSRKDHSENTTDNTGREVRSNPTTTKKNNPHGNCAHVSTISKTLKGTVHPKMIIRC